MEMIGFRLFLSANLNTYSLTVNLESFGDGDLQDKFRLGDIRVERGTRTANLEGFGNLQGLLENKNQA